MKWLCKTNGALRSSKQKILKGNVWHQLNSSKFTENYKGIVLKAPLILNVNCVKVWFYSMPQKLKGTVSREIRHRLLYIIQKLFLRRWTAKYLNFCLLKGHFKIYIKPLQRACPSPVTFACKCNNPSANCVRGQQYNSSQLKAFLL